MGWLKETYIKRCAIDIALSGIESETLATISHSTREQKPCTCVTTHADVLLDLLQNLRHDPALIAWRPCLESLMSSVVQETLYLPRDKRRERQLVDPRPNPHRLSSLDLILIYIDALLYT
ncbi:hypothetical protein KIPB_004057 [Kipferlia bialata]|uniref:Uncharacterized protein n=1 Tax=Kipferlia bialata TaxID=797122 RepID=A0A9K3GH56_9EUKA|nr:hypothetical protein KIPB_004057 [Kipferlia bialata]|eukprot:g4057.t1